MTEVILPTLPAITGQLAGVDEVGRGPLIGAVVTAAVILDPQQPIVGLNDSKKLSASRREQLAIEIKTTAIAWALGRAEPAEIDQINILQATLLAMQRAVTALPKSPIGVAVDGNRCPILPYPTVAIIKGDGLVAEISAASIIAKVARDAEMIALDAKYPEYGFASHKGYPTKQHLQAMVEHGVLPTHRRSFKPVRACLALR